MTLEGSAVASATSSGLGGGLLDRAGGEPIQEYARKRLFEPLGMRNTRLHLDEYHRAWTYADMETTPRDLARIGVLMSIAGYGAGAG